MHRLHRSALSTLSALHSGREYRSTLGKEETERQNVLHYYGTFGGELLRFTSRFVAVHFAVLLAPTSRNGATPVTQQVQKSAGAPGTSDSNAAVQLR